VGPLTNTERVPHEKDNHELLRFVGRTNDDQNPSLPFLGAELKKMGNSNDSSFIRMSILHNRSL
jgi:hypothetical protein